MTSDPVKHILSQFGKRQMTTTQSLAERLEELSKKATPGPWECGDRAKGESPLMVYCDDATGQRVADLTNDLTFHPREMKEANAALITELVNNLPTILSALRSRDSVTRDERMFWFLKVLAASGGSASASDWPGEWTSAFCNDREPTDTYNLADELGYTQTSHDTSSDCSTVYLTDKGKEALAALSSHAETAGGWETRIVRHGAPEYQDYLKARFYKHERQSFEWAGHRWRYRHTSFDDAGDFDVIERPRAMIKAAKGGEAREARMQSIADDQNSIIDDLETADEEPTHD